MALSIKHICYVLFHSFLEKWGFLNVAMARNAQGPSDPSFHMLIEFIFRT